MRRSNCLYDYSTGYRYYSVVQMQKALNIVRLKGLRFSLEEIRTMYDSETQHPSIDMLEEKIRSCQEQLQLLTECRDRLSAMIPAQIHSQEGIDSIGSNWMAQQATNDKSAMLSRIDPVLLSA